MQQHPQIYSAQELRDWPISEEFLPGLWRPARPLSFQAPWWTPWLLKRRLKFAWGVLTGRYDVVNWDLPPEAYLEVATGQVRKPTSA